MRGTSKQLGILTILRRINWPGWKHYSAMTRVQRGGGKLAARTMSVIIKKNFWVSCSPSVSNWSKAVVKQVLYFCNLHTPRPRWAAFGSGEVVIHATKTRTAYIHRKHQLCTLCSTNDTFDDRRDTLQLQTFDAQSSHSRGVANSIW